MNAPVERPAQILPKPWPMSVAAYHALGEIGLIPERTELVGGAVYHKMSKSPLHSFLVSSLLAALQKVVPGGCHLRSEQPITCSDSEPAPDLALVRGNRREFRNVHPATAELVIEVCVTSHEYDRLKLRAYARAGVQECWLILGPERQIEILRQPTGDHYTTRQVFGPSGCVTSVAVPGFSVDLAELFAA